MRDQQYHNTIEHYVLLEKPSVEMYLVTTDLARCYAIQMIKLKQILLHKRWQLIFFYFGAAKSGRTRMMACPLGPKSVASPAQ